MFSLQGKGERDSRVSLYLGFATSEIQNLKSKMVYISSS